MAMALLVVLVVSSLIEIHLKNVRMMIWICYVTTTMAMDPTRPNLFVEKPSSWSYEKNLENLVNDTSYENQSNFPKIHHDVEIKKSFLVTRFVLLVDISPYCNMKRVIDK